MNCTFCGKLIAKPTTGEPFLIFKSKQICSDCYKSIIPEIYKMAGFGDGGFIHLAFDEMLKSNHNRKNRKQISQYNKTLNKLLHKYNFECVHCKSKDSLTIDHIKPVSKGGTDNINNLQILCKRCNSKKGAKYDN